MNELIQGSWRAMMSYWVCVKTRFVVSWRLLQLWCKILSSVGEGSEKEGSGPEETDEGGEGGGRKGSASGFSWG